MKSSADAPSGYASWVGPDRVTSYPFGMLLVVQIA
jgi:hypothetical protein